MFFVNYLFFGTSKIFIGQTCTLMIMAIYLSLGIGQVKNFAISAPEANHSNRKAFTNIYVNNICKQKLSQISLLLQEQSDQGLSVRYLQESRQNEDLNDKW